MKPAILLFVFLNAPPSIDNVDTGLSNQHAKYVDIKFIYSTETTGTPPVPASHIGIGERGSLAAARNELILFRPDSKPGTPLWRSWKQFPVNDQPKRIDSFVSWDGSTMREYFRNPIVDEGRWSHAVVSGTQQPFDFACNEFDNLLFLGLSSNQSIWGRDGIDEYLKRMDYTYDGEVLLLDSRPGIQFTGNLPDFGMFTVSLIRTPHGYMTVKKETSHFDKEGKLSPSTVHEITEIKRHHGIMYPARGKFTQFARQNVPAHRYTFSVTGVEPVTAVSKADWQPDWPMGTIIVNQQTGEVSSVSQDAQLLRKAIRTRFATTVNAWIFWANIAGSIVL